MYQNRRKYIQELELALEKANKKIEEIRDIATTFFKEDAKLFIPTDLAECYEALGKIKTLSESQNSASLRSKE